MSDKRALRRDFRQRRHDFVARLTPESRLALEIALADIAMPALRPARLVGSYAAVGDEMDPAQIEARIGPHAFPRVHGQALTFHVSAWSALVPGFQGIPEPAAGAPQVMPDLLLVPLVAVTPSGVRLGQGRGYYDRALAELRRRAPVTAVGIAFDVQIAESLPADPWDMPLDWVATPTRLFECAKLG